MAVNSLGLLDLLQVAVAGLQPKTQYTLLLTDSDRPPFTNAVPLTTFVTWPDGAGVAQAIGPLKQVASAGAQTGLAGSDRRYLIISPAHDTTHPVLVERMK